MNKESDYEQYEVDEQGRRSYYVNLTMGVPIIAVDEDDAEEQFIRMYFRENVLNGISDPNGYTSFETSVSNGPQLYRRKKNAPVVCDKCKNDIDPAEFDVHVSGECLDRQVAAIQALIDNGMLG